MAASLASVHRDTLRLSLELPTGQRAPLVMANGTNGAGSRKELVERPVTRRIRDRNGMVEQRSWLIVVLGLLCQSRAPCRYAQKGARGYVVMYKELHLPASPGFLIVDWYARPTIKLGR